MLRISAGLVALIVCCVPTFGQGKGVDKQSERVRDTGTRTAGANGTKQDTGTGRGVDFGSGRTAAVTFLPNPYRITARRDVLILSLIHISEPTRLLSISY